MQVLSKWLGLLAGTSRSALASATGLGSGKCNNKTSTPGIWARNLGTSGLCMALSEGRAHATGVSPSHVHRPPPACMPGGAGAMLGCICCMHGVHPRTALHAASAEGPVAYAPGPQTCLVKGNIIKRLGARWSASLSTKAPPGLEPRVARVRAEYPNQLDYSGSAA